MHERVVRSSIQAPVFVVGFIKTTLEGKCHLWTSRPQNHECHLGELLNNLLAWCRPTCTSGFQILVKAEGGWIFHDQLSCLSLRIIFVESKAYLSRPHDSGFSLAASHVCTTCNCLSEKCHSRCFRPPGRSEQWCCSGSRSRPCRSLEGEKARNVREKKCIFFLQPCS